MAQQEQHERLTHKLEGPFYQDGRWSAKIELRGVGPKTFYGMTEREVQAQMLEYLDQIVQELERAHALLYAALEDSGSPTPNTSHS